MCVCVVCALFRVGSAGEIQLNGEFILEEHCTFINGKGLHIHTVIYVPIGQHECFITEIMLVPKKAACLAV